MIKTLYLLLNILFFSACSESVEFKITEKYDKHHIKSIETLVEGRVVKKVTYAEDGSQAIVDQFDQDILVNRWTTRSLGKGYENSEVYFPNGQLRKKGYLKNGKKVGKWTFFHRDGNIEAERLFHEDKPTGIWVVYNHHHEIDHFEDHGLLKTNGQFVEFYRSGNVKRSSFFNNKKLDGMYVQYYENGKVKLNGQYRKNLQEGSWTYLTSNGTVEKVETYNHGLLDGEWKQYFKSGQIKLQGKYANNKRVGQWVWYDKNGNDTHSKIY